MARAAPSRAADVVGAGVTGAGTRPWRRLAGCWRSLLGGGGSGRPAVAVAPRSAGRRAAAGFALLESAWEPAPRPAPPGTSLFAVGDIHGLVAHLDALLAALAAPIREAEGRGDAVHLVLVGDYVNRGPSSLGVLDRLPGLAAELGVGVHLLRGNHDWKLLDLLDAEEPDPERVAEWRRKGGDAVLRELGLTGRRAPRQPAALVATVRERLGPGRVGTLRRLTDSWRCGGWLFVHAGVGPTEPLDAQDPAGWLTLREPFLSGAGWAHDGLAVVHGHTVRGPEVLPHRVGIDSGAYRTGVLTAVQIAGDRLRFLSVADREDLAAFRALPGPRRGRKFERSAIPAVSPGRGGRATAGGRSLAGLLRRAVGALRAR